MGWILEDLVRINKSYTISEFPFLIGRNTKAQVICHGPSISKNHAIITSVADKLYITDTSTNGVYIDNTRIIRNEKHEIGNRSVISLSVSKDEVACVEPKDLYFFRLKSTPPVMLICMTPPDSITETVIPKQEVKKSGPSMDFLNISGSSSDTKCIHKNVDMIIDRLQSEFEENPLIPKKEDKEESTSSELIEHSKSMKLMELSIPESSSGTKLIHKNVNLMDSLKSEFNIPKQEVHKEGCASKVTENKKNIQMIDLSISESSSGTKLPHENANTILSEMDAISKQEVHLETASSKEIRNSTLANKIDLNVSESNSGTPLYHKNVNMSIEKADIAMSSKNDDQIMKTLELDDSDVQIVPTEDDIIVIPDDEEDFLLSQLYCIKGEPNLEENDETFLKIKDEIAEMDKCDSEYLMCPILIEDDSSSSEDDELLTRLKKCNAIPKSPEIIFENESPNNDLPACSKNLHVITETISANHINKKLEVIEALPLESKSRKRKSVPPEKEKKKEKKTSSNIKKRKTEVKKSKVKVVENTAPKQLKRRSSTVKVKTSESRGRFLTDQMASNIKSKELTSLPRIPKRTEERRMSAAQTAVIPQINKNDQRITAKQTRELSNGKRKAKCFEDMKCTKILLDHKSFILCLFTWESSFFTQQNRIDITKFWPQIEGTTMTKMPTTYGDYRYYKRAMTTVVMSELFGDVTTEYTQTTFASSDKDNRDKLRTLIHVSKVITHLDYCELICEYYLDEKLFGDKIIDCSLVSFIPAGTTQNNYKTCFGVVGWTLTSRITETDYLDKSLQKQCKAYPHHKHTFSILSKRNIDIRAKTYLFCRKFLSIRRYLNKLSAIKRVEGVIAQQILCPNPKSFCMPECRQPDKVHPFVRMNLKQEQIASAALRFCSPTVESRFFLVQGPPGTGKSDLIINIVLNLLKCKEKGTAVLLLAQTNAAVDNLIRRLDAVRREYHNIRMVRMGQLVTTSPDIAGFHVDTLVARHLRNTLFHHSPHLKHDYRLLEEAVDALRNQKNRSSDDDNILRKKEYELKHFVKNYYLKQYTREEAKCRDLVFERANLICSTIGSSYLFPNYRIKLQFKCCVIDEATQATEPDTLLPLTQGVSKLILFGDTQQLPAFNNIVPKEYLFSQSLFSRIQLRLLDSRELNTYHALDTQYRMRPDICSFPNRTFYNGQLKTHVSGVRADIERLAPYLVLEQNEDQKTRPYVNTKEIDLTFRILSMISSLHLTTHLGVTILTPYNDQKNEFRKRLESLKLNNNMTVLVFTVDSFQGQEQDIIIMSMVLKMANKFVDNPQRLNVALTRARCVLYMIGSSTLFSSGILRHLQSDAKQRDVYVSSSKNMDDVNLAKYIFLH